MTATIILIILILAGFGYYKIVLWKDNKAYYEEHKDIFEAHKKIGYPKLNKDTQFRILDNEDLSAIKQLTAFDVVPEGLLDHYITIAPDDYFRHLKDKKIIEKMNIDQIDDKFSDGFYIEQTKNSFRYIFNDRGYRAFEKEFKSEDQLLKYLVFERLRLFAPKYKKIINRIYYA